MPSYVIKRSPGRDEYLYFSTVVDHPTTYVMSRPEMREFLLSEHRSDSDPVALAVARLRRADANGTSAMWPHGGPRAVGGWDDGVFLVTNCELLDAEQPSDDSWHELTREELFSHMEREAAADAGEADA